ncbi:MAG: hypothetical protein EPN93_07515 [Spirochaetes bacterium]|nr:MAG: hypothetical protein EPN93_07515 [Spirochaetota bacterium]
MSLKDKLKLYEKKGGAPARRETAPLESLGAQPLDAAGRTIYRFTGSLPERAIRSRAGTEGGPIPVRALLTSLRMDPALLPRDMLFLDLETTSLSTGTGNYPFLIGIGYLNGDRFVTEQYFMDDYAAEPAILAHLAGIIARFKALVTFNGKSFDVPLIKTRYRMHRVPGFPVDIPVLDLLYPCRRIFKSVYESCSLKTMEERSLGIVRVDDIPGWMIPDVYFTYQREGSLGRIPAVVEHNREDIVSMLLIMELVAGVHEALQARSFGEIGKRSLANLAHHLFKTDRALFLDVMDFLGDDALHDRGLFKKYSSALVRAGRIGDALVFWEKNRSLFAFEELAKHFEHRARDFSRALACAREARALSERGIYSGIDDEPIPAAKRARITERIAKRIARLEKKLKG